VDERAPFGDHRGMGPTIDVDWRITRLLLWKLPALLVTTAVLAVAGGAVAKEISPAGTFKTGSLVVDDQAQVGPSAPPAYRAVMVTNTKPTNEEQLWIEDDATNHVGTGGVNQGINVVARQQATFDTTGGVATATGLDVAVTATRAAGGNALNNTAILANASAGCVGCSAYSFFSSEGSMVVTDDAHFGPTTITGDTTGFGAATFSGQIQGQNIVLGGANNIIGSSGAGNNTTFNGDVDERTSGVDAWMSVHSTATGGRQYFLENSSDGGSVPDSFNIFDSQVRWSIAYTGAIAAYDHELNKGPLPSIASCGTGNVGPNATDTAGVFTSGNATTTCTVNFARTWTNRPSCVIFGENTATPPTCTISATAITCTVVATSTTYDWRCEGQSNSG